MKSKLLLFIPLFFLTACGGEAGSLTGGGSIGGNTGGNGGNITGGGSIGGNTGGNGGSITGGGTTGGQNENITTSSSFPSTQLQTFLNGFIKTAIYVPIFNGANSYIYAIAQDGGMSVFQVGAIVDSQAAAESAATTFGSICTSCSYTVSNMSASNGTVYTATESTNQLLVTFAPAIYTVSGGTQYMLSIAYQPA